MKQKIVIAEYISTGINFIDDVASRGYEPVLLEGTYPETGPEVQVFRDARAAINARFAGKYRIIRENHDYSAVLSEVREVNPALVIAGSEFGVELAARLSEDLGLPGNPASRIPYMTQKDKMHRASRCISLSWPRGNAISRPQESRIRLKHTHSRTHHRH
ncbi:MAG: hypothetical protein IJP89_10265 [Synergistaceae bacterium]|nr:hypothetical protein [Synergistaceae bacterium]MBR0151734.1 hypothetical protein [Synergistaceae bacterium]